uniref:Protein MPE1 n=1 Tax=Saccharomyces cerevisiae (strain ATCC 204508 / S288c) TaxID=559292 RepID=UPI001019E98F|nr:Chain B, Protein MPE1 [Saccharomyces cerevisiae S288C]
MSSTIFYRFKSQRNTSRILFDGTGLTVFDLKREIIQENKLGDGTDFQLKIYNPDTEEEYDDDAFVIPRSTSVIVKRSPAIKSFSVHSRLKGNVGAAAKGNATRYVTGRPRVLQKRQHTATTTANVSGTTEEERIASMFATQENQWEQTQEEMSAATPVFF